jgi:nucleoside-diphosphate-sugar epimerase
MKAKQQRRVLVVGGSGFIGGTLARLALEMGHVVTTVTRGIRPPPVGAHALVADRTRPGELARVVGGVAESWDLVVDTLCYAPDDARQDVAVFAGRTARFVMVSTDFVYDPGSRTCPQPEAAASYSQTGYGRNKRAAEEIFESTPTRSLPWTILRPCHVYGPGSELGCLPRHSRDRNLLPTIAAGEPLRLVAGGRYRQQPLFAPDLARTILSVIKAPRCVGRILNVAGPETIESSCYYRLLAEILGGPLTIEHEPAGGFLAQFPELVPFCCDRVNDVQALRAAGLARPSTLLRTGLRRHVHALLASPAAQPAPRLSPP